MSKSRIFLFLLVNFIGGVFARSFWEIEITYIFILIIFSIILLVVMHGNKSATLVAFIVLTFAFGIWLTDNRIRIAVSNELAGESIQGEALVIKKSYSSFGQNLIIEFKDSLVKVLLQVPTYPEYEYGNILKASCNLKRIENKYSTFDYKMYMAKDGVYFECENKKYEIISRAGGNLAVRNIMKLKSSFEKNLTELIPLPEGALASGILFGGSDGLSEEIKNDFSRTGMTHIVAVSGYNVTIIAEYLILLGIFVGLWRNQAIWFALAGIIIFVAMIGLPASVVRAGVMSGILLWAIKNGRLASSENAIIFAGAAMLTINPLLLRYDVGFQLSFLATLGIVLTSPFWEKTFIQKYKSFGIFEIIALSLSAQIFVLPIIAYNFKTVSLISLLANVLILPIVPVSMLLVFLVSVAGFVFPFLAALISWIAYLPLNYEIKIIHFLSSLSWASVEVGEFSGWWVAFYYIILMLFLIWFKNPNFKLLILNKTKNQND